jgi:uncharacterized protein YutE (UPF0331/DUF86 family)
LGKVSSEELLKEYTVQMGEAVKWLRHSYEQCNDISTIKEEMKEEYYDLFEALTSRYARVCDILVNKVYRYIALLQYEEPKTVIDVFNIILKRDLIDSMEQIRTLKDIRNEITHEYTTAKLPELFALVLQKTPELLSLTERSKAYIQKNFKL